jgi:hypothetical protein
MPANALSRVLDLGQLLQRHGVTVPFVLAPEMTGAGPAGAREAEAGPDVPRPWLLDALMDDGARARLDRDTMARLREAFVKVHGRPSR